MSNSNPKALHIVLNSVNEDSRVLKCAWTLGNAGWDVQVIGATPFTHSDQLTIGYAKILRLPLKPVVTQAFLAKVLRKRQDRMITLVILLGSELPAVRSRNLKKWMFL